jgi:hypothetical protein
MARSTKILLACVAMLAAMLLAIVMTPHRLRARAHDVFDINKAPADRVRRREACRRVERGRAGARIRSGGNSTTRRLRGTLSTRTGIS